MSSYSIDFRILTAEGGWDIGSSSSTSRAILLQGLSTESLFTPQHRGAPAAGEDEAHPCRMSTPFPPKALHLLWPGRPHSIPLSCSDKREGSLATGGALVSHSSVISSPPNHIPGRRFPFLFEFSRLRCRWQFDWLWLYFTVLPTLWAPSWTLNGRLLARVTQRIVPVSLLLSGNHHKTI